jgi:hypothetical protein
VRARKQWLARAKRNGANLSEQFVEQAVIVELAGQIAATDDPDVSAALPKDFMKRQSRRSSRG